MVFWFLSKLITLKKSLRVEIYFLPILQLNTSILCNAYFYEFISRLSASKYFSFVCRVSKSCIRIPSIVVFPLAGEGKEEEEMKIMKIESEEDEEDDIIEKILQKAKRVVRFLDFSTSTRGDLFFSLPFSTCLTKLILFFLCLHVFFFSFKSFLLLEFFLFLFDRYVERSRWKSVVISRTFSGIFWKFLELSFFHNFFPDGLFFFFSPLETNKLRVHVHAL